LVFHDVSPVRELERTRKEFVANVSHELRTPLSMISGYVETLLGGAKDDPAVRTRFLQIIQKHTQRLTFLIEDLLTISRLESGRIVMDFKRVELRPLVDQVFADFKSRATERKVTLQNQIPPLLAGRADPERLRQVFSNLVENAIKYGRVGGHVVVTGRTLEQQVEIQVQDDGPGIPVEAKERIFERFYRVDQSRSPDQGGTGLGLAIVKHIVQSHGGTVWLQSEPGKGATFSFTLPAAPNG
jgi:two-component system phosphate regulon sensor histidine kinase PhoR